MRNNPKIEEVLALLKEVYEDQRLKQEIMDGSEQALVRSNLVQLDKARQLLIALDDSLKPKASPLQTLMLTIKKHAKQNLPAPH